MMTNKPIFRTLAVIAATLFAVATPIVQALTGTIAVGQGNLVNDGGETLRAAGYAFAIWSIIYVGLVGYAGYQALPFTQEMPRLRALGWPSVVAMTGCGAWLIAAAMDAKWATVAIIMASAAVLTVPLLTRYPVQQRMEFWLLAAPLSLLAGWLTVASALNLLTVLTSYGMITVESAPVWAAGGILTVMVIGLAVTMQSRNWIYPLPIAWGLAGVAVAEQANKQQIAMIAAGAAVILMVIAGWVGTHKAILLPYRRQQ